MNPRPPSSTLFPYTTLFRSIQRAGRRDRNDCRDGESCYRFESQHSAVLGAKRSGLQREFLRNPDRKSTRLNSSHTVISYAVFCLKKTNITNSYTADCQIRSI